MKALVFDLDDTLVESSAVRPLRDEQDWDAVAARLDEVEAFDGAADMLGRAKRAGCKIAIVTSSPRWYAETLVERHGFVVDAIVAAGDYKYGKPGPQPIETALSALGVSSSNVMAFGDRCVDSASAAAAEVGSVGATWGAANVRDLRLSWPQYVVSTIEEGNELIDAWLAGKPPKRYEWLSSMTAQDVWRTNPAHEFRAHLSGAHTYTHARYKYRAGWSGSYTNSLIHAFKAKEANRRFFKIKAAKTFCRELSWLIPETAYVTYVLPSVKKGDTEYDDRWELLAECLLEKGIRSVWPLQIKQTTPAAHTQAPDSPYRDPAVVESNLEWVSGLPGDCNQLCIVDDVLTKGGHLRAYADTIKRAYPAVSVECIAWALHTSTPWYEPQIW